MVYQNVVIFRYCCNLSTNAPHYQGLCATGEIHFQKREEAVILQSWANVQADKRFETAAR